MFDKDALEEMFARATNVATAFKKLDDEKAIAIYPEGWTIRDVSSLLPPPNRPKQMFKAGDVESFIAYVRRHAIPATVIFVQDAAGVFNAIFDYHPSVSDGGGRGDCEHSALYSCPLSDEWKAWASSDVQRPKSQVEFARFIEENLPDIQTPPAAVMLQVANRLIVKKDVDYASDIRLDNGQTQLRYQETIRGETSAGDLTIPSEFTLRIPVHRGGPVFDVSARLRYRLNEGKLTIWHEIIRQQAVERSAVQSITALIRQALPGWPVLLGSLA